jgi:histidyl-tRNA synthetase
MAAPFRNIPGTFDILPDAYSSDGNAIAGASEWYFVESRIREVMSRFNIREIRTPILEPTELIARGIGQSTDIVTKEMFAFERGDTRYVLRPEVTASVMRSYLQHHLDQKGGTQRLFYMGPCFRAERPQKGRYRQFHQFGVEIIGADDARADAETIASMLAVYRAVGLKKFTLRINTLGSAESRPRYREALRKYFEPYLSLLTETSRNRLESNPLRILDTKVEQERELLAAAPLLMDYIDDESKGNYARVKDMLDIQGISYVEDPFLVRGLDYYSRTTFELESPVLGAQNALAGGGRYDQLSLEVGGKVVVPAVGFAAGFERLMLALAAEGVELEAPRSLDIFLVALGDDAQKWAVESAVELRSTGKSVAYDLKGRSMKAQMKEANRLNAEHVVIVGDDELSNGTAQVRDMNTSEQETISLDSLKSFLK